MAPPSSDPPPSIDLSGDTPIPKAQRPEIREKVPLSMRAMQSIKPTPQQMQTLWSVAGKWSPAGITAALLIAFFALGGAEGVNHIADKFSEASAATKALQAELAEARKERELFREQMQALQTRDTLHDEQILFVRELAVELNHGPPNETWASRDARGIRWEPPPPQGSRMPLNITAAKWPE